MIKINYFSTQSNKQSLHQLFKVLTPRFGKGFSRMWDFYLYKNCSDSVGGLSQVHFYKFQAVNPLYTTHKSCVVY